MKVPSAAKSKWIKLRSPSDIADIVRESGFSRPTITGALNGSECSYDVFYAIQSFYNKRQAKIDKLISESK